MLLGSDRVPMSDRVSIMIVLGSVESATDPTFWETDAHVDILGKDVLGGSDTGCSVDRQDNSSSDDPRKSACNPRKMRPPIANTYAETMQTRVNIWSGQHRSMAVQALSRKSTHVNPLEMVLAYNGD